MLLGKIEGNDVVDVANITLEHDALRELTARDTLLMRLYLPPIRTGTSATYDRGKDEWSSDDHIRDVN